MASVHSGCTGCRTTRWAWTVRRRASRRAPASTCSPARAAPRGPTTSTSSPRPPSRKFSTSVRAFRCSLHCFVAHLHTCTLARLHVCTFASGHCFTSIMHASFVIRVYEYFYMCTVNLHVNGFVQARDHNVPGCPRAGPENPGPRALRAETGLMIFI